MAIRNLTTTLLLLHLFKDFSSMHTVTSLSEELGLSRVGIWKVLKKLDEMKYISLNSVGKGRTSTLTVKINWENPLMEKTLALYLAEEALKQRRWQVNFAELEKEVDFAILYGSILHSPQEARDVDILGITPKNNFIKIQMVIDKAQKTQSKKIHIINFTENEFRIELQKPNKAFIDAVKKGVILFRPENFVRFMKERAK